MKIAFALASLLVAQGANAAVVLTNGSTYTQNFNGLASTGTSSTLPNGVQINESGANANTTYTAGTGSSNTGDTFSFGATGSTERALGGLRSGNLIPLFGIDFTNATGQQIVGLTITYTGEQWRLGTAGRADRLDFQYAVGSNLITAGNFIDVNALDFVSPITAGTVGALDGNSAANRTVISSTISGLSIGTGTNFVLRWSDFDATGADDALAIDDFSLTPIFAAAAVPEPTTWAMMISGFGLVGVSLRRQRRSRFKLAL